MNKPERMHLSGVGDLTGSILEQLAHNEKMAELGRLSVGMVHDLNSPLSVIASAVQLILREEEMPAGIQEMLERIDAEIHRLSQMVKGVLSFAHSGEEPQAESDVNQVMRDVMLFLRYEARKNGITIVEELDYALPIVAADTNRLKQIFINLIVNAFHAMKQGGALMIRTFLVDVDIIRIEISDTGMGIPAEELQRIFDPFFTTKKNGEGTGLGLFIVRKMVELMNGRISVVSEVGSGTCFTLDFHTA